MKYVILIGLFALVSCKKYQKGCVVNRNAAFLVDNESGDTCKFVLIQNQDTIKETILPYSHYEYRIKPRVLTMAIVYRADTIYNKSRDDFKMKMCEMDQDLIR